MNAAQLLEAKLAERDQAHKAEIAELTKNFEERLDALEREPDPARAPFRGTSAGALRTPDGERPSFLKAAQERDREERVGRLTQMAERHPDPALRYRAQAQLERLRREWRS